MEEENKRIQDDKRSKRISDLAGLKFSEGRKGVDAWGKLTPGLWPLPNPPSGFVQFEFEIKSTTTEKVSTCRDFSFESLKMYRGQYWLIGKFVRKNKLYSFDENLLVEGWVLDELVFARPDQLEGKLDGELVGKKNGWSGFRKIEEELKKRDFIKGVYARHNGDFTPKKLEEAKDFLKRGAKINNPMIDLSLARRNGRAISLRDLKAIPVKVVALMKEFPMEGVRPGVDAPLIQFED
jgi:hypothetical protein